MKCCKCNCSFANCIKEHKINLDKEFNEMITNWMKNHPEVVSVWIGDKNCCLSNTIHIFQDRELSVNVHFE
jgi:hypothetical protein